MKRLRPASPDDQENVEKAYEMLMEFLESNKTIEPNILDAALWGILVDNYIHSEFSYEEFCDMISEKLEHYKHWWDEK